VLVEKHHVPLKAATERAAKLSGFTKRFSPNFPVDPSAVFTQSEAELHLEADRGVHRQGRKFRAGVLAELTLYARQLAWLHAVPKAPAAQAVGKRGMGRSGPGCR
jgi:hypothetical protein